MTQFLIFPNARNRAERRRGKMFKRSGIQSPVLIAMGRLLLLAFIVAIVAVCNVASADTAGTDGNLTIPTLTKRLSVVVSSEQGGCNLLTGRCEISNISIDWKCDTVDEMRTCSGTLSQLHLLNGAVVESGIEVLSSNQVTYNRYTRGIVVVSELLATTVRFSEVKAPGNTRTTSVSQNDTPSAGVCGQGCYWIPRKITRVRSFILKAMMDGFTHPIDGGKLEESLEITYTKERFL